MIAVTEYAEGCILPVRAQPGLEEMAFKESKPERSRWP